jgi:uncharacterized damage-inducible protein DinB
MPRLPLALLVAAALPVAHSAVGAQQSPAVGAQQSPAVGALRQNWRGVIANFTRAAEELSEADYAYRPVATVRTFGQLFGHVAGAQYAMCAAALGEPARGEDEIEKTATTKAALVKALKASTDYCTRAYSQTDAAAAAATQLYGESVPRLHALAMNAVHDGEHYGNVVTYMRIKGLVPPSSRR